MKKIIIIIVLATAIGFFPRPKAKQPTASPSRKNTRAGTASWYSHRSPGIRQKTASNEKFNDRDLTCAMWGVEFNRKIKVTNLENGKSVIVRVNDRGPHKRFVRKGRIIDLTKEAFSRIASTKKGIIKVEVDFL